MRTIFFASAALALLGCASQSSYVHSDTTLGRVVVYRNGVAYFERSARVESDELRLAVPSDKVDDFLKSLTVVDAKTGEAAPIAYPTRADDDAKTREAGLVDMKIRLPGAAPHDLKLSYVTEAPSWKPSYRVTLEKGNKVAMQAWAIVDNTSGEDWQNVQLAVGSSSALSFRFDLRSVRTVSRATLQQDDLFAQAPPMGEASYANNGQGVLLSGKATPGGLAQLQAPSPAGLVGNLSDEDLDGAAVEYEFKSDVSKKDKTARAAPSSGSGRGRPAKEHKPADAPAVGNAFGNDNARATAQLDNMANLIKSSGENAIVMGFADPNDRDKDAASLERANKARQELIRRGVAASQIQAVGAGQQEGKSAGVSVVLDRGNVDTSALSSGGATKQALAADPIGVSHFESKARMSVPRGSSAMVSILSSETDGEVVYYYDAETPRGNTEFPFRAVRLENPTDSVLESGPVTVFGDGKFVGEGMAEPIPARSNAFIPFALDRQIFVEKKDHGDDAISKILSVERGVFSTEVQHTKRATYTLHNRSDERAVVYLRHTVLDGYKLVNPPKDMERLGAAYLYKVVVEPRASADVTIEESTPVYRTTDLRSPAGLDLVVAFLSKEAIDGPLKSSVTDLLNTNREMANLEQRISTLRDEMSEYRERMDELHAQLVTLKAVKTAGPLMQNLEKKLSEVSDKVSKATIDVVALQEKLMVARIKFQDGVADLSLEKKDKQLSDKSASTPSGG